MFELTETFIKSRIADTPIIYYRGRYLYEHGSFALADADPEAGLFSYDVDGNYGDYVTRIVLMDDGVESSCDCPYPENGCKHTVAVMLDVRDQMERRKQTAPLEPSDEPFLSPEEIRKQALADRESRARTEEFKLSEGEMLKGVHMIETKKGRQYEVTLHDPGKGEGHCTCPDFLTNRLGVCKHLIYLRNHFKKKPDFEKKLAEERFPFVDIFWDSINDQPKLFSERPDSEIENMDPPLDAFFDSEGRFTQENLPEIMPLLPALDRNKRVRVQPTVLAHLDALFEDEEMAELSRTAKTKDHGLGVQLYPYQEEGVKFALFKKACLIGDEMGLGKTLQAIALAVMKKEIFGFKRVLVITLASLKEQWKREIERFSDETAVVVAGPAHKRKAIYRDGKHFFAITNYEAVLRDVTIISHFKPDIVILDEAQRIKNFSTKTAEAVKRLPRKHALVLTGTPLENKLEDVYSIVQFLDSHLLMPLWQFAADHFMISRKKKGHILGYRNLSDLHEKLKPLVIRRKKEEVLKDLPDEVVNNYYVDLHEEQREIHSGYLKVLVSLMNKKFLTPMDLRRIQEILVRMRMVCDSTYLIDRTTHISPKLTELASVIDELVVQSKRKMVIFSEWTTMTFLIARHLSEAGIPFVELSGKVPVNKRQALIDEFTHNLECRVFLSTDAGGTGLNLQAADCVVNFELPWNPAKMNQRIGRVSRIGQKSKCINVVNFICKGSIEEKIYAGIQLKTDLFKGVFEGGEDVVEFSREKRTEMLNKLREMMGEEPELPPREQTPPEEIPEDTPHFLNPEVLKEDKPVDFAGEEVGEGDETADGDVKDELSETGEVDPAPEKMEAVLNSGMAFIGGLLEVATGKKMSPTGDDERMVKIDKTTGEVTLKFKLPGF
ncbi:MAG: DEAD/DEAH box helicase family protein [Deltaproteobacteria bacterium]|nr:DEAD/DEAH box helicase family protein [Deltaproteobacteria bacterium]